MRAWGRLLRLSLAPTAVADLAAGVALGGGAWDRRFGLLVAGSLCVYHGGMALNDWADRAADATTRPDRPIPSGRVPARAALACAVLLLLAGPVLAFLADPLAGVVLAGVALAACAYDLGVRGPFLLALCRAGNLSAGIALAHPAPLAFLPAIVYATYVAAVSWLARLEDADPLAIARARPARPLLVAAGLLLLAPLSPILSLRALGLALGLLIAVAGATGLVRAAKRRDPWTNEDVCRSVGLGLRRLLVFTAALAASGGGPEGYVVAAAILCGYPIAYALRGVFPPS